MSPEKGQAWHSILTLGTRSLVPAVLRSAWPLPTLLHREDGCLGATSRWDEICWEARCCLAWPLGWPRETFLRGTHNLLQVPQSSLDHLEWFLKREHLRSVKFTQVSEQSSALLWDFPGGPLVKAPDFQCSIPGWGTEVPHAALMANKQIIKEKTCLCHPGRGMWHYRQ